MKPVMTRHDVFSAIEEEAEYQDQKWGEGKEQSLAGYLLIMEQKLNDAKVAWMKDTTGRQSPLAELLKVVSVGVRALEQYGNVGNVITVNETPVVEYSVATGWNAIELTSRDGRSYCVSPIRIDSLIHVDPTDPDLGSVLRLTNVHTPGVIQKVVVQETVERVQILAAKANPVRGWRNA